MLVIDFHTLESIDILDLINDISCESLNTQKTQNVLWISWAVHNQFALVHDLTIMDQHTLLLGDQGLMCQAVHIGDDETLLTLGVLTK